MKAYWFDNQPGDQREDHDSGKPVPEDYLEKLGLLYYQVPEKDDIDALAQKHNYKNRDEITVSPEKMGDVYEEKVKMFFHEHLHEDIEARYILEGKGFFDVRAVDDEWVRIALVKGDVLILPAGIYHRFTTDTSNHVKAMRLFHDAPKWTPLNRAPELDDNASRKAYLSGIKA